MKKKTKLNIYVGVALEVLIEYISFDHYKNFKLMKNIIKYWETKTVYKKVKDPLTHYLKSFGQRLVWISYIVGFISHLVFYLWGELPLQ